MWTVRLLRRNSPVLKRSCRWNRLTCITDVDMGHLFTTQPKQPDEHLKWASSIGYIFTSPRAGCEVLWWVCLFLSLSTHITRKPHSRISPNFLCMLPMAVVGSCSGVVAIHYAFPVLWMTSRFHTVALHHTWHVICIPNRQQNTTTTTAEIPTKFCSVIASTHHELRTEGKLCYLQYDCLVTRVTWPLCLVGQKHERAVAGADNKDMCKDKEPFEKQLYKFMREKKTPIKRLPSLGFKEGQFTLSWARTVVLFASYILFGH